MSKPRKSAGPSQEEEQQSSYHVPVLLNEVLDQLQVQPNGVYVDCTFGGGGHSMEILKKLGTKGRLLVFDQDEDAKANLPDDNRVTFVQHNFRYLQRFLRLNNALPVDGILADLGVSSHQFDEAGRGFSTRFDADLDMRMDTRQELTAFKVIRDYSQEKLHQIFGEYGEVTNAKTLAASIVQMRNTMNLKTIANFKSALHGLVKGNPNKYFAQVFQALRIEVNDELGALKELLEQVPQVLAPGGRVAIITFHSLEDRLVKNFFKKGSFAKEEEENPYMNTSSKSELEIVTKKPIIASAEEQKKNSRSRSAKLRVASRK